MGIDARIYAVTAKGSKKFTPDEVWHLGYEIGLAFGADKFTRTEKDEKYGDTVFKAHHNISLEATIEEDSNEVPTRKFPGQQILEVHVWTRYYGVGYERGDLPFIIAVAEWLEAKLPGCEVRYGGDSSGVVSEPFPHEERMKLLKHLAGAGGRAYFQNMDLTPGVGKPSCEFCRVPMTQYGWRGGYQPGGKYVCHGCGARKASEDGRTFVDYEELKYKSRPVSEILHAVQSFLGKFRGENCVAQGDTAALHRRVEAIVKEYEAEFKKDLEF